MSEKEYIVKIAFLTIGLLPFFSLGILLVVGSIVGYLRTKSSRNWPSTHAKITGSFIKKKIRRARVKYKPQVSYSYSIGGKTFSGSTINFTGRRTLRNEEEARESL